MDAERKTYPVRFPLELIDSPLAGIQSLVQPTQSLKIALHIPPWPGNQATTLVKVVRASKTSILSLEQSHVPNDDTLLPSQFRVSS